MSTREASPIVEALLSEELDAVEALLRQTAGSEHPLLNEAAGFLIAAGGKRFRPAIVLAASKLGEGDRRSIVACAAAIELMHLATLYHDDVMDETELRRGVDTAHRRYGNARAILVGDYLFARASGLAADLGTYVARRLADTIADLVDGQVLETEISDRWNASGRAPSIAEHLEVIQLKTGALISSSAHLGAFLAGCDRETVDAVTTYGEAVGLAFQLADDLLDITGDVSGSGKQPGTDLRAGIPTLPAIATLAGEVPGGDRLAALLSAGDHEMALTLLRGNGAVEVARKAVAEQRARATSALTNLPAGPGRELLAELAGAAVDRSA